MEKEKKSLKKENYITPAIEVVTIVTEQNILAGGSDSTYNDAPNMSPINW